MQHLSVIISAKEWEKIKAVSQPAVDHMVTDQPNNEDRQMVTRHAPETNGIPSMDYVQRSSAASRQKELEKEEQERIKMARETELLKAEERRKYIEDAKNRQFYDSDEIRRLHGAYLLSKVLAEREVQVERRQKIRDEQACFDRRFVDFVIEDLDRYKDYKNAVKEKNKRQQEMMAVALQKQIREAKEMKNREYAERVLERQRLAKLDKQYQEEMKKLKEKQKAECMAWKSDLDQTIGDSISIIQAEQKMLETEEQKRKTHEESLLKMKNVLEEKNKEMIRIRQGVTEKVACKLASKLANEQSERQLQELIMATRDAEEKSLRRVATQMDKVKNIRNFNKDQVSRLKMSELKDKDEQLWRSEERYKQQCSELEAKYQERMEKEMQKKEKMMKECIQTLFDQMGRKKNMEQEEKRQDIQAGQNYLSSLVQKGEEFEAYAQEILEKCEDKGWVTHPVQKRAELGIGGGLGPPHTGSCNFRPSYAVTNTSRTEMPYILPQTRLPETTSQRLGFMGASDADMPYVRPQSDLQSPSQETTAQRLGFSDALDTRVPNISPICGVQAPHRETTAQRHKYEAAPGADVSYTSSQSTLQSLPQETAAQRFAFTEASDAEMPYVPPRLT